MLLQEIFPKSKTNFPEIVRKYSVVEFNPGLRMRDRVPMRCSDCDHVFIQRANNIFSQGIISCKCGKFYRKTEEELLSSSKVVCTELGLEFKGITYAAPLTKSEIQFRCNVCDKDSTARYELLAHLGIGCTYCTKKYRPSREEYQSKLNYLFDGAFTLSKELPQKVTSKTVIDIQCLGCNNISSKSIAAVIYNKVSCTCITTYGYDNSKPGYMYLISLCRGDGQETFYKVGITCDTSRRFRELSNTNNLEVTPICIWDYPANGPILEHELLLKNNFSLGRSSEKPFEYGYTESVLKESLPMIMTIQTLQYRGAFGGFST